jgi:DNA-binding phage protein
MDMKVLESNDVVALLRSEVGRAGGQAAWASKAGINRIVVNKILNGHGLPTKKIVRALKLRTVFISESELQQSK